VAVAEKSHIVFITGSTTGSIKSDEAVFIVSNFLRMLLLSKTISYNTENEKNVQRYEAFDAI
jgi:hypothetical protein